MLLYIIYCISARYITYRTMLSNAIWNVWIFDLCPPQNIYNVDETGMTTVQGTGAKILAMKGRRQVGCLTTAECGQFVTVTVCVKVTRSFLPPFFIFPCKCMKAELMDGSSPGSRCVCHPSGWMQLETFSQSFDHFITCSGASKSNTVLMI